MPDDIDTTAYLTFLNRIARYPLLRDIGAWDISDPVVGVVIARFLAELDILETYAFPGGPEAVDLARQLGVALDHADLARIWRQTDPAHRPDLGSLLPAEAMTRIETNQWCCWTSDQVEHSGGAAWLGHFIHGFVVWRLLDNYVRVCRS